MFKVKILQRSTELRHVPDIHINKLAQMLNTLDAWKALMRIIPAQQVSAEDFGYKGLKYKFSDIELIENASRSDKKLAAAILFDEWGTSGKVRPTLSHLLQLLTQLRLFQAADYVAIDLLKEPAPVRPSTGVAAKIDISLPKDDDDDDEMVLEQALSEMGYPSSAAIVGQNIIPDVNKDFYEKRGQEHIQKLHLPANDDEVAPVINTFSTSPMTVSSTSDNASRSADTQSQNTADFLPQLSGLLGPNSITSVQTAPDSNSNDSISDSTDYSSADIQIPNLSAFNLQASERQLSDCNIPMLSELHGANNNTNQSAESLNISHMTPDPKYSHISSLYLPHMSVLTPNLTDPHTSLLHIPNVSQLHDDSTATNSTKVINNQDAKSTDFSISNADQSATNLPIFLSSSYQSDDSSVNILPNISLLRL